MRITRTILLIIFWTIVIAFSVYFFFDNVVAYLFGYRSPLWGDRFFNNQFWVSMHLFGGTLALFFGPVQFWEWLRKHYTSLHRNTGKLYMAGIVLIGISAFRLSLVSPCVPCRVSLFLLTVFAVLTTAFAWLAIKRRNIKVHRQMMVRSYVCVLAFVLVRIGGILPLDFLFGTVEDPLFARVIQEYFWSFVPLIITEIFITWWPQVSYMFKKGKGAGKKINS